MPSCVARCPPLRLRSWFTRSVCTAAAVPLLISGGFRQGPQRANTGRRVLFISCKLWWPKWSCPNMRLMPFWLYPCLLLLIRRSEPDRGKCVAVTDWAAVVNSTTSIKLFAVVLPICCLTGASRFKVL